MSDPADLSCSEALAGFRSGSLAPSALLVAQRERYRRWNPRVNAFVSEPDFDALLAHARGADERWRRGAPSGPLDGLVFSVKDAIRVRGFATGFGSLTRVGASPEDEDAPAVARLREAGALPMGKTTTSEFGWKGVTDSPAHGTTRNPFDRARTAGGSSGGAAAAMRLGIGSAAIGTDAAGSVRIPASFCGLVALKATRGRVPAYPPSVVWTLGHIGPIARTVEDVALLLEHMTRPDARDWNAAPHVATPYRAISRERPRARPRIAVCLDAPGATTAPAVRSTVSAATEALRPLCDRLEAVQPAWLDVRAAFGDYFDAGLAHGLRALDARAKAQIDPGLRATLDAAVRVDRERFLDAYDVQIRTGREARLFHRDWDFLITPTVATAPFAADRDVPDPEHHRHWLDWTPFTYPFNFTGQPALTLPCGRTDDGLPIGLQVVADLWDEARLLALAAHLERELAWTPEGFDDDD